jgi:HSP20 family protein
MNFEMEPWRPFREAVSLRDAVDRLLSDSVIAPRAMGAMPKVDIRERKEDILVKAELPGIAEEDIDVEVSSDGVVTISGEKKEEKREDEEGYQYRESHIGSFTRSFSLPAEVIAEKTEAEMKNGVLILTIPKAKPQKVQKVKVGTKKSA